jgi:hypothetical protein
MIAIEETAIVQPNGSVVLERPELKPGSQVKVILLLEEPASITPPSAGGQPGCFFEAVRNLKLDGPADWSEHLDDYLYHAKPHERE